MKSTYVFYFIIFYLLFTSCAKEDVIIKGKSNSLSLRSNDFLNPDSTYIYNGSISKLGSQITETDSTHIVYDYSSNVYVFNGNTAFRSWIALNSNRNYLGAAFDTVEKYNYLYTTLTATQIETIENGNYQGFANNGHLYRDENRLGPIWPITSMNYGSRRNTASSIIHTGQIMLANLTWLRGAKMYSLAIPGRWYNLAERGRNDRADSGMSF